MAVAEHLKEWRTREGLTQVQASGRIGVTQPTYSEWEAKKARPRIDKLQAISTETGVPLETLLAGEQNERPTTDVAPDFEAPETTDPSGPPEGCETPKRARKVG